MIFANIDVRGRLGFLLKTKGVFWDKSVRSRDVSFINEDFQLALWGI